MKEKIKVAVIGIGNRGSGMLSTICMMDDVDVIGVCDEYEDRAQEGIRRVEEKKGYKPFATTNYKEIFELEDLDSVYIATDWSTHVKIAIEAMKAGIPAASEVGGAYTLDECWEVVDTYEKTGVWAMFMENCCYGERELMIHNMVRDKKFGKIVACSGKYAHDLRDEVCYGTKNRHYRLRNYISRNCENYPTHALGPIAKLLDINRGNRFTTLTSVCSGSYGLKDFVKKHKDLHDELKKTEFAQADIVKTFITTERGEVIDLTLDTCLPRFYSRGYTIRGLKGLYQEDGDMVYFDKESYRKKEWDQSNFWGNAKRYERKYNHDLWKNTTKEMMEAGHGGMDWHVLRAWVETVKNGTLPPIDVYDMAAWMCITALSEQSLKNNSAVIEIPDFTRGKYKNREPQDETPYTIK